MLKRFRCLKRIGLGAGLVAGLLLVAACGPSHDSDTAGAYPTPMATARGRGQVSPQTGPTSPVDALSDAQNALRYYVDSQRNSTVFAGCYVEHDPPMLHVNVAIGKLDEANLPELDGLMIHEVQYSIAELEKVRSMIAAQFKDSGISGLSISLYTNTVVVYTVPESESLHQTIREAVPNEDMVTFMILEILPFYA